MSQGQGQERQRPPRAPRRDDEEESVSASRIVYAPHPRDDKPDKRKRRNRARSRELARRLRRTAEVPLPANKELSAAKQPPVVAMTVLS